MAQDVTVKLILVIAGVIIIGIGLLVLDWATYDVTVEGPLGTTPFGEGSTGLDFDEGKISLIAAAVSFVIGLLGLKPSVPRPMVGLGLVLGSVVVTAATVYFLANIKDEVITVPGLRATAEASIAPGGPVTIAGAIILAIAGVMYALEPPAVPSKP